MFCQSCGSEIKDTANFCKYCGAKVKKTADSTTKPEPKQEASKPETNNPAVEPPRIITKEESLFSQAVMSEPVNSNQYSSDDLNTPISSTDPFLKNEDEKFDPITDETIDILYSRERDVDIKDELKENLEEVEKIGQRLNIGLISKEEAADQIQEKQNLVTALKAERKSLKAEKITIEVLEGEIKELQNKLDKLHIMKNEGKISHESVYNKLKTEYDQSLTTKQQEYQQQKINITHWLTILEFDVQKMKEDIDMATTKADLGELPKEEAESKKTELEIEIYRKELAYHALKTVNEKITAKNE